MSKKSPREIKMVLLEGALVAVMGAAFAFAANAISPRGVVLLRNHFPGVHPPTMAATSPSTRGAGGTNPPAASAAEQLAARLKANGLQLVGSNLVKQLFRDPRYEQELVVFIDARDDERYQEGHVPGAYQFDHYRAEDYLPNVLPVCRTAEQILLYCHGGTCEDSEFSAIMLSELGIPKAKLFIYDGGMTEWMTNGLPVETGSRKSGQLLPHTR
jgi:rhodanese-related sulfurtransferase